MTGTGETRRGIAFFLGLAVVVAVLTGLGVWQVQRRAWKHDLIARVAQRIHAPPRAAPGPEAWSAFNRRDDEYRAVRVSGYYLPGRDTFVQAVTELGGGYWVLTPLRADGGFTVLINRGFLPIELHKSLPSAPIGPVTVTGLLRVSEPGGGFLRDNQPTEDRWYSRDVVAIAAARHLPGAAPYFVDARGSGAGGWPRGGLTVVQFPDNHLVYAMTWFGLALLVAGFAIRAWRVDKKS